MTAIETGGLAIKFLNLQQVKRLYGLINAGGVIASILGYLTIPFLMPLFSHAYDLLSVGVIGIALSMYFVFKVYGKHGRKKTQPKTEKHSIPKYPFKELIKNPYFLLIFVSASLSMVVIYFSDFGFLASIKSQKERLNSPVAVANFIAIVYGSLKIGELIISIFSSRLLSRWGINMGLSILPLVAGLLIIGATISSFTSGVSGLLFFGFIVLNKSFERILRRGLDDPSFNILYQPLKNEHKLMIQTRVGVIMQLAIGIAGIFLYIATKIFIKIDGTFDLSYFSVMFVPFLIIWFFVTRKLYASYKQTLREILEEKNKENSNTTVTDIYGSDLLIKQFESDLIENTSLSVTILVETNPEILEPYAKQLINTNDKTVRKAIYRGIAPTWDTGLYYILINLREQRSEDENNEFIEQAIKNIDYTNVPKLSEEKLKEYTLSNDYDKNLIAVKNIKQFSLYKNKELIANLLNTAHKPIKQSAIFFAKENNDFSLIKKLVKLLESPEFRHIAANKLIACPAAIPEMEKMLSETQDINISLKIIEIYARMGNQETKNLLLSRINSSSIVIQEAVIKGLYYCRFQANEKQTVIVKQKIQEFVGQILWLFVCISEIERQKNVLKLVQALDIEHNKKFEMLFYVLAFTNKPATIELIKTNIIGENIIYALEIIDNFISQDIKKLIIPVFDKISVGQRVKKLKFVREIKKLNFEQRLKEIINADDTEIDLWTKTKSLELLGKISKKISTTITQEEVVDNLQESNDEVDYQIEILEKIAKANIPADIFQSIHHKDELIYSTAARIVYTENPKLCIAYLNTLGDDKKKLIKILKNENADLLNEKVKYIRRVPSFFGFPENTLVKLARLFTSIDVKKGGVINFERKGDDDVIFIVVKGKLSYKTSEDAKEKYFRRNDTIVKGFNIPAHVNEIHAKSDTTFLSSNRFSYFNLLVYEIEVIENLFVRRRTSKGRK